MKRLLPALGLLAILAVVAFPILTYDLSSGDEGYEPTHITDYTATFVVDDGGDLTATEKITVDFPQYVDRHGIFRFWDVADANDPHARRVPHDVTVTRDDGDEPFEMLTEQQGRFHVARIGSASSYIEPGEHTYVLSYRMDDVLLPGADADHSEFYWDLVPSGWAQSIDKATLTVQLPGPVDDAQCAIGSGSVGGCAASTADERLTVSTGYLEPRTPVTVRTGVEHPTPDHDDAAPWAARFDPVLGRSGWVLATVLVLSALAGLGALLLARRTREVAPPFPLQYAPPDGVGPGEAAYLLSERVEREGFVANLMEAAEKGVLDLDRDTSGWRLTDVGGPAAWARLGEVTETTGRMLGVTAGGTFTTDTSDVVAGKTLQSAVAEHATSTRRWARAAGLVTSAGLGTGGAVLVGAAAVVAVALALVNPFSMSIMALVPGAFAVGGLPMTYRGASTMRTPTGRDLWSRIGGFERVLSTPSSVQRFEFAGRQELYTAYLPWAVAFGCADAWAAKFRTETGGEPPAPAYFGGYLAAHAGGGTAQMVGDFSATVDSAISSYEATQQPSSSGGGGGFSGGGGGGGGGGGSW